MNGFINFLKPPGISSAQAVGKLKRIFGVKKAGHTGTLDPAAAGVLPICLGRATKFSDYIMSGEKEYIAEISFGLSTDTLDSMGKITNRNDSIINLNRFEKALSIFSGEITQSVPAYSAVKKNGQPMYKLARNNKVTEIPNRKVFISSINILSASENKFLLKINCSKGTYVRTLIDDLGKQLNTFSYTSFLLRTKNGNFQIDEAYTLDELYSSEDKNKFLIPVERAINMPRLILKDYLFDIITTGSPVDAELAKLYLEDNVNYKIYCKNEFLGVGQVKDKKLKLKSVYYLRECK